MKSKRQAAIRKVLKDQVIQTQEDLAKALRQQGFQVTQATVSRDMKEMRLIKISSKESGYHYAESENSPEGINDRLIRMLRDCVLSTEAAGQMVVVKTMSGSANTAAEAIDTLDMPEIVGSIAGDNTIFLVARDHSAAVYASERIQGMIR